VVELVLFDVVVYSLLVVPTERLKFSSADFISSHEVDGWRLRSTTLKGFSLCG
jgi:hypothetical protein